jgi:hypothetical protein
MHQFCYENLILMPMLLLMPMPMPMLKPTMMKPTPKLTAISTTLPMPIPSYASTHIDNTNNVILD